MAKALVSSKMFSSNELLIDYFFTQGGVDAVLFVLLQELPRRDTVGVAAAARLLRRTAGHPRRRSERLRLQAFVQEPHVFLQGRE